MKGVLTVTLLFTMVMVMVSSQNPRIKIFSSTTMYPLTREILREYAEDKSHENLADALIGSSREGLDHIKNSNTTSDAGYIDIAVSEMIQTGQVCFPVSASGIAVLYNFGDLPTSQAVTFSMEIIVGIFNGTVTRWNDSVIAKLNVGIDLPTNLISLLYRTDACGSIYSITKMFSQYSSEYDDEYGVSEIANFPVKISQTITSSVNLGTAIDQTAFSFALLGNGVYRDPNSAISRRVRLGSVLNDYSRVALQPSPSTISSALAFSPSNLNATYSSLRPGEMPSETMLNLFNINHPNAYPMVMYSYFCVNSIQSDFHRGSVISHLTRVWITYLPANLPYFYSSLPPVLNGLVLDRFDQNIQCGNAPCKNWINKREFPGWAIGLIVSSIIFIVIMLLVLIGAIIFLIWRKFCRKKMQYQNPLQDRLNVNPLNPRGSTRGKIDVEDLTLEEQVGSGSFSEVYKGKWLGTPVAIKRILVTQRHDQQSNPIDDFVKETSIMSGMRHPNIVQYLGSTMKSPHLYIITEYCERGNVQSILRDSTITLTITKTIEMALDAARGMWYLHSSKPPILHRDFKSANLLVDGNWTVKVADFGLSRVFDKSKEMTVCGTAETCAPEVLSRSSYTEKADVYSFGIVLWEMLTREQLYKGLNFYELSSKVVNEDMRPDLTSHNFPEELSDLMQKCWDVDQYARPGFDEIVDTLVHYLESRKNKRMSRYRKPTELRSLLTEE